MQELRQYRAAAELEQYLGDPSEAEGAFSFRRAVELDEREEYPEEACRLLNEWGLQDYYIPQSCGGRLSSYEELVALVRVVARRDFTVSLTHALTYVGGSFVWVGGNDAQRRELAEIIRGGGQVAVGFHEKAHGSDLLASEVEARSDGRSYLLSGEKWVIGNPRRGAALSLFARTDAAGGPRGFSIFLVRKNELDESTFAYLHKIKTSGVRGHEISGISFRESVVPEDALIGAKGEGLEIALKCSQVTRTAITAHSLGAGDTALRATLDFALRRVLYGEPLFTIPYVRATLVDAFLDLLICDCLLIAGTRALHVLTGQMSVWSAVVKYFVSTTIEEMNQNLSTVLGARHYLREGHWSGIFQKIVRDCVFTRLTHFSSVISLSHLGAELRELKRHYERRGPGLDADASSSLKALFSLHLPVPGFDPARLSLHSRGRNYVIEGLEDAAATLTRLHGEPGLDGTVLRTISQLTASLLEEVAHMHERQTELAAEYGREYGKSVELLEVAKSYCRLHAAAACLQMWLCNRHSLGEFFAGGEWLALSLERLLKRLNPTRRSICRSYVTRGADELVRMGREASLFSIIPFQLTPAERPAGA